MSGAGNIGVPAKPEKNKAALGIGYLPQGAQAADIGDPDSLCQVSFWQRDAVALVCTPGEKIVFMPKSFGNEQLPVYFAAINCDLHYPVVSSRGEHMITLDQVKLHLRVDAEAEDFALVAMLVASTAAALGYLNLDELPDPIPAPIEAAILLQVGDLYANRERQSDVQL